jgi:hypothetical protein
LLFEDSGYYVVVVGFGDFAAVEGTWDQRLMRAEVVNEDFAVDLRGVEHGAALPEEFGFVADAFYEQVEFAADPLLLAFGADLLLEFHEALAARLDDAFGDFGIEIEGG